ncbi:MAG: hypothetical protein Alpg2KO_23970 [Alphaproteobacteria bacterium]
MSALTTLNSMTNSIRTGSERLANFFRRKLVDGVSLNPGNIIAPAARAFGILAITGMLAVGMAPEAEARSFSSPSYTSTQIATQTAINTAIMTTVILASADADSMDSRMEAAYMDCMIEFAEENGYNGPDAFDAEAVKACAEMKYADKGGFERTYEIVAKAELAGEANWEKRPSDQAVADKAEAKETADKVALGIVGGLGIGMIGFMGWMVYDASRWRVATPSLHRRRKKKLEQAKGNSGPSV